MITELNPLTESEIIRIDLRAQHIYRGLPPLLPWGDAGEATRNEFRRRAMRLMLFDGTLLYGTPLGGDDHGYAEVQALEAETAAVIRGELTAGEMWEAGADESQEALRPDGMSEGAADDEF